MDAKIKDLFDDGVYLGSAFSGQGEVFYNLFDPPKDTVGGYLWITFADETHLNTQSEGVLYGVGDFAIKFCNPLIRLFIKTGRMAQQDPAQVRVFYQEGEYPGQVSPQLIQGVRPVFPDLYILDTLI